MRWLSNRQFYHGSSSDDARPHVHYILNEGFGRPNEAVLCHTVLTAGHCCMHYMNGRPTAVTLSAYNLNAYPKEAGVLKIPVDGAEVPKDYSPAGHWDVCILRLAQKAGIDPAPIGELKPPRTSRRSS